MHPNSNLLYHITKFLESIYHIESSDLWIHASLIMKKSIECENWLGEWMAKELGWERYSIRIYVQWNPEKLIDNLWNQLSQIDEHSEEYINVKVQANESSFEYAIISIKN